MTICCTIAIIVGLIILIAFIIYILLSKPHAKSEYNDEDPPKTIRGKITKTYSRGVVIAQDFSQSMEGQKIDIAIRTLNDMMKKYESDTFLGVLGFSDGCDWIAWNEMTSVKKVSKDAMKSGNTALGYSIAEAIRGLADIPTKCKVLVILTDGYDNEKNKSKYYLGDDQKYPAAIDNIVSLFRKLRDNSATYSIFIIGVCGDNTNMLQSLSIALNSALSNKNSHSNSAAEYCHLNSIDDVKNYLDQFTKLVKSNQPISILPKAIWDEIQEEARAISGQLNGKEKATFERFLGRITTNIETMENKKISNWPKEPDPLLDNNEMTARLPRELNIMNEELDKQICNWCRKVDNHTFNIHNKKMNERRCGG
jgi:hypothetical protein